MTSDVALGGSHSTRPFFALDAGVQGGITSNQVPISEPPPLSKKISPAASQSMHAVMHPMLKT